MLKNILTLWAIVSFSLSAKIITNSEQQTENLASHPYWLKLLRYEKHNDGFISAIKSEQYFLSKDGKRNPKAELQAALKQLNNGEEQTFKCQFPERYRWLKKQIGDSISIDEFSTCSELSEWANLEQLNSASLVYASGYLGNPASFFGHILLKFNYLEDKTGSNIMLDNSINFGAEIPPEDGAIVYVFKGFFGGYTAAFKEDSFYRHHNAYAKQESRTLWQYELNLTDEQLLSLVLHVWELRSQQFDYYYLNDNCASRMAELIAVVNPDFKATFQSPWVQPITVFKQFWDHNPNSFRSIKPIPSSYSQFLESYQNLSEKELSSLIDIYSSQHFDHQGYKTLSTVEKTNVINTLLDYSEYQQDYSYEGSSKFRQMLLGQRFLLPAQQSQPRNIDVSSAPHLGQQPSTLRVGITTPDKGDIETTLTLRPTYYDLLSSDVGRLPNSAVSMGTIEVAVKNNDIALSRLDLANILSLSPAQTQLQDETNLSWKLRVGLENTKQSCHQCLMGIFEFGAGSSMLIDSGVLYGLAELRLQGREDRHDYFSNQVTVGALYDISNHWRTHLELNIPISGWNTDEDYVINWQNRIGESINSDWRINLRHSQQRSSLEVAYSYYWY